MGQRRVGIPEDPASTAGIVIDGDTKTIDLVAPAGININGAPLAGGTSHTHAAYAPLAGAAIWLPPAVFSVSIGTPVIQVQGGGGRYHAWQFDAGISEQVNTSFRIPVGWTSAAVDVYWSNAGAGTGEVVWSVSLSQRGDGDDLALGDVSAVSLAVTAPLLNILKVSAGGITVTLDPAKPWGYIRILRTATSASDTLPNDAAMFGLLLRRVS